MLTKKKITIIVSIVLILVLAVSSAYLIDKSRMNSNKPVVFSTWGYDYAPPVEHENITEEIPNISKENTTVSDPIIQSDTNTISGEKIDVNGYDELSLTYEKQLNVVLNNKSLWYKDTEYEKYSYAVTDLDQNGRIDIISSICQGTGLYTYTEIYEINENMDGLNLCKSNLMEYDSEADMIKNNWTVFYDNTNNEYHYIFDDLTKNGAAEYYENKRDFCLNDGEISESYLVYKTIIYQNETPTVTCTDLNNNVINEEQYNNFENEFFNNYEKMMVNIEWLSNYTEIKFEDLKDSYDNFKIYKVENSEVNNK